MRLDELISVLNIENQKLVAQPNLQIQGIAYDSRNVNQGYLFVARSGASKYIDHAISKGAVFLVLEQGIEPREPPRLPSSLRSKQVGKIIVKDARKALALLSQKFYQFPSKTLKIIGVTGTYGKTTSTWLLKSIYEASGMHTGLVGTIEYQIGKNHISAHYTTPESLDLQRIFSQLKEQKATTCILEVSSHAIALSRVYGIDFDIVGFTKLGRDHLDFHGSIEEYEKTKLKLFSDLKPESLAVLNRDDPNFSRFKEQTRARIATYGTTPECDVWGKICSLSQEGIEIVIKWDGKEDRIFSKLMGRYNLYNILLAATCALKDGISSEIISAGIESLKGVPGRFERIGRVIIDYAHTPGALESTLRSARELASERVICIFGCGGDRDRGKRPQMGKIASELADYVILTTDNPRSEKPEAITQDIVKGITSGNFEIILDRKEAIRKGIERSSPEDLILLVGKGHENYQIYGEIRVPWDEREAVREILTEIEKK